MASIKTYVYIYDNTGSLIAYSNSISADATIGTLLSDSSIASAGITELSATIGGEMLSHDSIIRNILSVDEEHTTGEIKYKAYKYEEPEPSAETVTGFYLDGTEYKFEGGGGTADGISTSQPSNPVAGSTYYDTTNKVVKVYNGTSWEEVGGGNVIAMTQAEYDALTPAEQADGKLRIITDAPSVEVGSPIVYCTQVEYDKLPSSKTSDGKNYFIYK